MAADPPEAAPPAAEAGEPADQEAAAPAEPRPPASRAQQVSAVCSLIGATAAIVGVFSFYKSTVRERVKDAQEAVARIYPMDTELKRFQADHPGLRGLFRNDPDGARWRAARDPALREKFWALCSMAGNLFEYYLLIRDNIKDHPKGADIIVGWDGFLGDVCKNSHAFRGYIQDTRPAWSPMFLAEFDRVTAGMPPTDDARPSREPSTPPRAAP